MLLIELPQLVIVLMVGLMLVLNNVILVLLNVLHVLAQLITVYEVNQAENKLLQPVHVHPDKLKLKDPVIFVTINVLNVLELLLIVLLVLLIELIQLIVHVQMVSMMMVIPPNVKLVKTFVPPVPMEMVA